MVDGPIMEELLESVSCEAECCLGIPGLDKRPESPLLAYLMPPFPRPYLWANLKRNTLTDH